MTTETLPEWPILTGPAVPGSRVSCDPIDVPVVHVRAIDPIEVQAVGGPVVVQIGDAAAAMANRFAIFTRGPPRSADA
jgi:hypothetical protein